MNDSQILDFISYERKYICFFVCLKDSNLLKALIRKTTLTWNLKDFRSYTRLTEILKFPFNTAYFFFLYIYIGMM